MVSEHSRRGVSISLLCFHKICSLSCYIIDQSVLLCCFSLDLIDFTFRTVRSIILCFKIGRSKCFDQVLNKTVRILVDYVTDLLDLKVASVCVFRSVLDIIDQCLLNLKSSSVESDLFSLSFESDKIQNLCVLFKFLLPLI